MKSDHSITEEREEEEVSTPTLSLSDLVTERVCLVDVRVTRQCRLHLVEHFGDRMEDEDEDLRARLRLDLDTSSEATEVLEGTDDEEEDDADDRRRRFGLRILFGEDVVLLGADV